MENKKDDSFFWVEPTYNKDEGITQNDIREVTLPVKCTFRWSDQIVADVDENDNPVEYMSGWIMEVIPNQTFVYNKQETILYCRTAEEHDPENTMQIILK
jgi:hypothetical protein